METLSSQENLIPLFVSNCYKLANFPVRARVASEKRKFLMYGNVVSVPHKTTE